MKFRLRSLPAGWEVGPMAISWCVVIRGNQEAGGTKKERATGVERGPTLEKKKWSLTGTFSGTPQVAPMRLWRVNGRVTYPETACVPFSCQTPRVLPFFCRWPELGCSVDGRWRADCRPVDQRRGAAVAVIAISRHGSWPTSPALSDQFVFDLKLARRLIFSIKYLLCRWMNEKFKWNVFSCKVQRFQLI